MDKTSKELLGKLREKLLSPAYLAVMTIGIVILGNLFNYLDNTFGTNLNCLNPLLVLLAIVLFGTYIYSIRGEIKNRPRH
ncbi:MAG: hypothetical protein H6Q66_2264 [Firmicutes bacterium]|nr:hypothetical protein [Bacillota bacterium]